MMSSWCQNTGESRKHLYYLQVGILVFAFSLILATLFNYKVNAAETQTINFQGRLLTKSGEPVKDGNYNIEFKIYQGGDNTKAGSPGGKLVWKESYLNSGSNKGIEIKNGRFTAQLGSKTAFDSKINWSSNQLWLSMNIAGFDECKDFGKANCKPDGELLPMKRISGSAYAMSAGRLGDKSADDFVQLGQGRQTDSSSGSSIFINKTGQGNLIQLQNNGNNTFTVSNSGDIELGAHNNKGILIQKSRDGEAGKNLTISAGEAGDKSGETGGDLILSGGDSSESSGGDIILKGGTGSKNDGDGLVIIGTPTFSTTTSDPNCYKDGKIVDKNCEIAVSSLNSSAAIIVGFSKDDLIAALPNPANKTAGRIFYVIGASDSKPFSLKYNTDNSIDMLPDTATSLIWSGETWVIIGSPRNDQPEKTTKDDAPSKSDPTNPDEKDPDPIQDPDDELEEIDINEYEDDGSAAIGSMFYNEGLGKIQCYQADGWGECLSAPDIFVTLSPEYAGAVMNGNDIGTITSDLCSDTLGINNGDEDQPEICAKDETYNFYKWQSNEDKMQTRSIYLNYKLPANFKKFVKDSTSLSARIDHDKNANVSYQIYRDSNDSGLIACGSSPQTIKQSGSWEALISKGINDPAGCDFSAGDSMLIRIDMSARKSASAYVSDIDFIFSSN